MVTHLGGGGGGGEATQRPAVPERRPTYKF